MRHLRGTGRHLWPEPGMRSASAPRRHVGREESGCSVAWEFRGPQTPLTGRGRLTPGPPGTCPSIPSPPFLQSFPTLVPGPSGHLVPLAWKPPAHPLGLGTSCGSFLPPSCGVWVSSHSVLPSLPCQHGGAQPACPAPGPGWKDPRTGTLREGVERFSRVLKALIPGVSGTWCPSSPWGWDRGQSQTPFSHPPSKGGLPALSQEPSLLSGIALPPTPSPPPP